MGILDLPDEKKSRSRLFPRNMGEMNGAEEAHDKDLLFSPA